MNRFGIEVHEISAAEAADRFPVGALSEELSVSQGRGHCQKKLV